ncbi:MAG: hypothetical protein ACYS8I_11015 [Planctomycetota bacterium]|jgi:hypothetical protein
MPKELPQLQDPNDQITEQWEVSPPPHKRTLRTTRLTYPERFRNQVRAAFLTGQHTSFKDLCRSFNVEQTKVAAWRRDEGWDDLKLQISRRAREKLIDKASERKSEIDDTHYRMWGAFEAQVYRQLKRAQDENRSIPPRTLDVLSKVMERCQKGKRIACGADTNLHVSEERHHVIDYVGFREIMHVASEAERNPELAVRTMSLRNQDYDNLIKPSRKGINPRDVNAAEREAEAEILGLDNDESEIIPNTKNEKTADEIAGGGTPEEGQPPPQSNS